MAAAAPPIRDDRVRAVFAGYPPRVRRSLMRVRGWIYDVAERTPGVGPIEEALRWGEPAYLTAATGSGTTLRLAWHRARPDEFGIYVNCRTTIIQNLERMFPTELRCEGRRAIVFDRDAELPRDAIELCLEMALTYHRKPGRRTAIAGSPRKPAHRARG